MSHQLRNLAEARANIRIREKLPIRWQIKDGNVRGEGKILNVSATGLLLEVRAPMTPLENCLFALTTFLKGEKNFIPQDGRLVWAQKMKFSRDRYRLGIEFVDPAADILAKLQKRIRTKIAVWSALQKFQNTIGVILFVAMIALTIYALSQQSLIYHNIERSNAIMLSSSAAQANLSRTYAQLYEQNKAMLAGANKELDSTKALLAQTEAMLSSAQADNNDLRENIAALETNTALKERTAALEAQSTQLNNELTNLQNRLLISEEQISTVKEGREIAASYRQKIKAVKRRMQTLQKEAAVARRAAQKERDRILMLQGNNGNFLSGYFLFDGKTPKKAEPPQQKKIDIDVTVF